MPPTLNTAMRLDTTQYFPVEVEKTGLCIHHTVGGSARSTFDFWQSNADKVGTAYIIDRDGTIFEVFPPRAWAFQFGLKWPDAARIKFEKRFIGIELASEGGLTQSQGKLYAFDRAGVPSCERPMAGAFDFGSTWRSYRFYDQYDAPQLPALMSLINHLCDTIPIPRQVPQGFLNYYGDTLRNFEGVIGHTMVRQDKTDPLPDIAFWQRVVTDCGLTPAADTEAAAAPVAGGMTPDQIAALFEANVQVILKMNTAAGSMVKGLIQELCRDDRNTYLRLSRPAPDGHKVSYSLEQGSADLVGRIGRALGLTVSATQIEVPSS
jgi:hypothetical protein